MRAKRYSHTHLSIEVLERREVMTGNVTATVATNGQLTLTGNYQDNALVLWQGAEPGQVVVAGAKDYAGGNTLVNGSTEPVVLSGVKNIYLDLRSGTDRVLVTNLTLAPPSQQEARSIYAEMGAGNDQLVLSGNTGTPRQFTLNSETAVPYGPVDIGGSVFMFGRAGNDTMSIVNAKLGGDPIRATGFNGGEGNDSFLVDGSVAQNQLARLNIEMAGGNDRVSIKRATIASDLKVANLIPFGSPPATTEVDLFNVKIGNAFDMTVNSNVQAIVNIDGDTDPTRRFSAASVSIRTSDRDDRVSIQHAGVGTLSMQMNGGADTLELFDAVFDSIGQTNSPVSLGASNDLLSMGNVTVNERTVISGGSGTDTFRDLGGNSLAEPTITDFEA